MLTHKCWMDKNFQA